MFFRKKKKKISTGVKGQVTKPLIDSGGECATSEQTLSNVRFFSGKENLSGKMLKPLA